MRNKDLQLTDRNATSFHASFQNNLYSDINLSISIYCAVPLKRDQFSPKLSQKAPHSSPAFVWWPANSPHKGPVVMKISGIIWSGLANIDGYCWHVRNKTAAWKTLLCVWDYMILFCKYCFSLNSSRITDPHFYGNILLVKSYKNNSPGVALTTRSSQHYRLFINLLWSYYAIWPHRFASTMVWVMVCCLMCTSHYLS